MTRALHGTARGLWACCASPPCPTPGLGASSRAAAEAGVQGRPDLGYLKIKTGDGTNCTNLLPGGANLS